MDRLTINLPFTDGNPCYHYVDKEAAYNGSQKLGQYEDIGTPEELAALKAENERLTKQLENAVVLPCKVGDTVYWLYTEGATGWSNAIKKCQVSKISISSHYTEIHSERTSLNDMNLWGIMGKDVFLLEYEAIARLAELGGKE